MFRDLGFIWYISKDILKGVAFIAWVASSAFMNTAPAPWDWICFSVSIIGFIVFFITMVLPLIKDTLRRKYRTYRATKEEAWDILKESK